MGDQVAHTQVRHISKKEKKSSITGFLHSAQLLHVWPNIQIPEMVFYDLFDNLCETAFPLHL